MKNFKLIIFLNKLNYQSIISSDYIFYEARNNLFFGTEVILILIKCFIKVIRPNHTHFNNILHPFNVRISEILKVNTKVSTKLILHFRTFERICFKLYFKFMGNINSVIN